MHSATSRQASNASRQAQLRAQIAVLTAQLDSEPDNDGRDETVSVPSKRPVAVDATEVALVPATPSPKKRRIMPSEQPRSKAAAPSAKAKPVASKTTTVESSVPSTLFAKLASQTKVDEDESGEQLNSRSTSFTDAPSVRNEDLTLTHDLSTGAIERTPHDDDPLFERLEPNSGIRLKSRSISNARIQDYLYGRYYISPSKLYSIARLRSDKQGYDIPVPGDWVTIAVVAERGEIKQSRAPVSIVHDEDDDARKYPRNKKTKDPKQAKPKGKKFVNFKLIDFGARSTSSSNGPATIRGDAFLSLLLFEADKMTEVEDKDHERGRKKPKRYHGGSRGAFESLSKLKEGDVLVILNPNLLKPYSSSSAESGPRSNIIGITPSGGPESIQILGRAADLGMCTVNKKNGEVCGSWTDRRNRVAGGATAGDVCEYHLTSAVERTRAGRAEFTQGTAGLKTNAKSTKANHSYDTKRQFGLTPKTREGSDGGGATYVVGGHVLSATAAPVNETIGREGQAKAQRRQEAHETEKALKMLLSRDKEGTRKLQHAREAMKPKNKDHSTADSQSETTEPRAKAFSARVIQNLGFDPTTKSAGHQIQRADENDIQHKLSVLASAHRVGPASLDARPGRTLSNVSAPVIQKRTLGQPLSRNGAALVDLDSDSDS